MSRKYGSILGAVNIPNATKGLGNWDMRDVYEGRLGNTWPSTPTPTPTPTRTPTPTPTPTPGIIVTQIQIYSTYNGGERGSNYNIDYSDDNSNWTTAFSGNMDNGSSCGIILGSVTGSGSYGRHVYWRLAVTTATASHFPRSSRIDFIDNNSNIHNLVTFTSDNCSDLGDIPGITVSSTIGGTFLS
jgi:hypothetical protein